MTASKVGLVALPVVWMALVTAAPNAAQTKSVVDGVYSEAQATRGAEAYKKDCSSCHGEGLDGDGFAPGLAGSEFLSNWNGPRWATSSTAFAYRCLRAALAA